MTPMPWSEWWREWCADIARQALKDTPNTFDISRQEARMAAARLKDSDNA